MPQPLPRPQLAASETEDVRTGGERRPVLKVVPGGMAGGAAAGEAPVEPPAAGPVSLPVEAAAGVAAGVEIGGPRWILVKAWPEPPRALWLTPAGFLPFPLKLARLDSDGMRRRVRPIPFPQVTPQRTYLEEKLLRWETPLWQDGGDE
jgi:hypothetical protein